MSEIETLCYVFLAILVTGIVLMVICGMVRMIESHVDDNLPVARPVLQRPTEYLMTKDLPRHELNLEALAKRKRTKRINFSAEGGFEIGKKE